MEQSYLLLFGKIVLIIMAQPIFLMERVYCDLPSITFLSPNFHKSYREVFIFLSINSTASYYIYF